MATGNKEIVRRIFDEIVNQRREDVIDELFDENFVDHGPGGQDLHGREEFRATIKAWLGAFPDVHCEVSHVIEEGDTLGWIVRTTGPTPGTRSGFRRPASRSTPSPRTSAWFVTARRWSTGQSRECWPCCNN
jgi:predicted SnoaL-like aldol condensation-catalyzing enzyme